MGLTREKLINSIIDSLSTLKSQIKISNAIHFFDCNIAAEDFICGLLNIVNGWTLENLNNTTSNCPGIDLGSKTDSVAVQVTSNADRRKIQNTIEKFIRYKHNESYRQLVIFIIGDKQAYRKTFDTQDVFEFDVKRDIVDFNDIICEIKAIQDTRKLEEVEQYISYETSEIKEKKSIAQCMEDERKTVEAFYISKLTTLGASKECAKQLLESDIDSDNYDYIVEANKIVLIGDYGSGKSHALYSLYLKNYNSWEQGETRTIPRFASASTIIDTGSIEIWANKKWLSKNDSLILIDGLDEIDYRHANKLLDEAYYIEAKYDSCRVLIATRDMSIIDPSKSIQIKELDNENIDRVYGVLTGISAGVSRYVDSNKRASNHMNMLTRPFFLVAYCSIIKDDSTYFFNSIDFAYKLINRIIDKQIPAKELRSQLASLAELSIKKGMGRIHRSEINPNVDIDAMLKTGFVERVSDSYYQFPLPLIAQWLAALGLRDGTISLRTVLANKSSVVKWRYPLSIYFSITSFACSAEHFSRLVTHYPGIAGLIIKDGIRVEYNATEENSDDCGEKLQYCMSAWVRGIGPLSSLLNLSEDGYSPNSLMVYAHETRLTYAWARKRLDYEYITQTNNNYKDYGCRIDSGIRAQSTWPWIITYEVIKKRLGDIIKAKKIPLQGGQIEKENIWNTALRIKKYGSLYHESLELSELISSCPTREELKTMAFAEKPYYEALLDYSDNGAAILNPPFPIGDRESCNSWIWSDYSCKQMLKRISFEFEEGIKEYKRMVNKWFSFLKYELALYASLPARVVGQLKYNDNEENDSFDNHPVITWVLVALEDNKETKVDISYENLLSANLLKSLFDSVSAYRYDNASFVDTTTHSELCFNSTATPVTDWVYKRVEKDLKRLGWIDR